MKVYRRGVLLSLTLALLCAVPGPARLDAVRAQTPDPPPPAPARPAPQPPNVSAPAAQDEEFERVETNLVNVLFNAVDRERRFVTTLKAADLRVYEDGVPQQIATFERETNLPLSLAILVDVSWSQQVSLPDEQEAARIFIDTVLRPEQDRAAILSFTGTATIEQDLTAERAALRHAVDELQAVPPADKDEQYAYEEAERAEVVPAPVEVLGLPGSTALWDAVWASATELLAPTPPQTRRAIILLTDGDDTTSRMRREDAVTAAVKANTIIYAIGIAPICDDCPFDKKALRKLSEQTGGRAFFPADATELQAAFAQIQQELRTQYLVAYAPTNKQLDGSYRRIRLDLVNPDLKKQKVQLTYREGYFAIRPHAAPATRRTRTSGQRLARPPRRPRRR